MLCVTGCAVVWSQRTHVAKHAAVHVCVFGYYNIIIALLTLVFT